MTAGVNCWHCNASLHERECLHCQRFIQVLSSDVVSDVLRRNWSSILFTCTKVHPRSMIPFIINDVHIVITKIIYIFRLLFILWGLEDVEFQFLVTFFLFYHFRFLILRNLQGFVESTFAEASIELQVLLSWS